ncbi:MAG: adenosine kinase [Actinobacteria bacterium]|nr:adenosine kinase [Actinomycetota bacterium]
METEKPGVPASGISKKYMVVGIGNAIVDILANVEDRFLDVNKIQKGMMQLIDETGIASLNKKITAEKQASGGSAANTIAGLASLGHDVAFIGKVKNDELGLTFEKGLNDIGVMYCTKKASEGRSTGCCVVLMTPDAQRTMNTCLGISGTLGPEDIDEEIIAGSKVVYLEGYLWDTEPAKEAFKKAIRTAEESGGKVALSLSDSFCVERHREEFLEIIGSHTNILFANEDEIKALFEVGSFEEAARSCQRYNNIFALTRGELGSVIIYGKDYYEIGPEKGLKVLDTTGAGDMFAAGFLHGYINKKDLSVCGRMGNITAAAVIAHFGARPEISLADVIEEKLKENHTGKDKNV